MAPGNKTARKVKRKNDRIATKKKLIQDKADRIAKDEADKIAQAEAVEADKIAETADVLSFSLFWDTKQAELTKKQAKKKSKITAKDQEIAKSNLYENNDWPAQTEDPEMLIHTIGPIQTSKMATDGYREAMWSKGYHLVERGFDAHGFRDVEKGYTLIESAADIGHVCAMHWLGEFHRNKNEYDIALAWFHKGSKAGLPKSMYNLAKLLWTLYKPLKPSKLQELQEVIKWFRKAANAGSLIAAKRLSFMYETGSILGGVNRSKEMSMRWRRKAAEIGNNACCFQLATRMYRDSPYARTVGLVEDTTCISIPSEFRKKYSIPTDFPQDILTSVVYWLRKGGSCEERHEGDFQFFRTIVTEGLAYCDNEGCEVVRLLQTFKVCPQCKTARFCCKECFEEHWTTGGHKTSCGKKIQPLKFVEQGTEVRYGTMFDDPTATKLGYGISKADAAAIESDIPDYSPVATRARQFFSALVTTDFSSSSSCSSSSSSSSS